MSASSRPRMATVLPSPKDQEIFRDLAERFAVLAQTCFQFSRDIYLRTGGPVELHDEETIRRNISIAQHDFGNRLVEILAIIYFKKSVSFQAPIRREIRTNATVLPEAKAPRDPPERRRESDGSPRASGPRAVGRTLR